MIRCPNCRTKVDNTFTTHCPECGTSVTDGVESMTVLRPDLSAREPSTSSNPPPPPPPASGPGDQTSGGAAPSMAGRIGRGIVARLVIVALIGIGVSIYRAATDASRDDFGTVVDDGAVNAADLRVGDCLQLPDASEDSFETVTVVPCDDPHDAELYSIRVHPAADDVAWPGSQLVAEWSDQACYDAWTPYVGVSWEEAQELDFTYFTPTEYGWGKLDDRVVQCLIIRVDGSQLVGAIDNTA